MKKLSFLVLFMLSVTFSYAQDSEREYRTILDGKDLRISGMGGAIMQFSSVAGEFGHLMGGGGGLMLNNFFFGGYGLGLTNRIIDYADQEYNNDILGMGHGGFWIGYSLFGNYPVHLSLSTLIGWGEITLSQADAYIPYKHDQIFVLSPTLEAELNITRYLRVGAGVKYSLFSGVNVLQGYSNQNFSSPGGFLSLKFGWF